MIIDNKDYYIVKKVDKWGVISLDKEIILSDKVSAERTSFILLRNKRTIRYYGEKSKK